MEHTSEASPASGLPDIVLADDVATTLVVPGLSLTLLVIDSAFFVAGNVTDVTLLSAGTANGRGARRVGR